MWTNLQFSADLGTFTEEILNGKLHFLCSDFRKTVYHRCLTRSYVQPCILFWTPKIQECTKDKFNSWVFPKSDLFIYLLFIYLFIYLSTCIRLSEIWVPDYSHVGFLTFPVPTTDEQKKLSQIFIFTLLCGASKGLIRALRPS